MIRPLGVRPFTGIIILVGGLLLLGGCQTLGQKEPTPAARVLPGEYPLYFSLDIAEGGAPVAEILEEQEQPGLIVKTWLKGNRLWGAIPARGGGGLVLVFEGSVPRVKSSLGLFLNREWNKSEEGDWWEDSQGGQIAFSGGDRLYFSRGGMDQIRAREENRIPQPSLETGPPETGRILGEGDLVVLGEGKDFLSSFVPLPSGVDLTRWILRLDRSGDEWKGGMVLTLEEEGQARFLGTTLKLFFLRFTGEPDGINFNSEGAALFLHRLQQARVTRRGVEVILGDMVISNPEFSGLIKEVMNRGLMFP